MKNRYMYLFFLSLTLSFNHLFPENNCSILNQLNSVNLVKATAGITGFICAAKTIRSLKFFLYPEQHDAISYKSIAALLNFKSNSDDMRKADDILQKSEIKSKAGKDFVFFGLLTFAAAFIGITVK
jgi:hypothetical protein